MNDLNLNRFIQFVNTITKIVHTTSLVCEANEYAKKCSKKRAWMRPRNMTRHEAIFFRTCIQQMKAKDEEHFYKATGMHVGNFQLLLSLLEERLQRFSRRKSIKPETRLALTLFYLTHGCSVQVCAWAFKMGLSTVRKIIYETCEAIWQELHDTYLATPNATELKNVANKFYAKTGMPNCLGAIDAKHIYIIRPKKRGSTKKSYSIVLIAGCDANYVFRYVDVGTLEGANDVDVFARSAFGRKLLSETLVVPNDACLPGTATTFPYFFVADSGFPLKRNLMRPFPGRDLPPDKNIFNAALSKARLHIENAFGILANRWRILHTNIKAWPKNVEKIVLATVVLHNFLILQKDKNYLTLELVVETALDGNIQVEWQNEMTPLKSYQPRYANRSSASTLQLRDTLKAFLQSNVL